MLPQTIVAISDYNKFNVKYKLHVLLVFILIQWPKLRVNLHCWGEGINIGVIYNLNTFCRANMRYMKQKFSFKISIKLCTSPVIDLISNRKCN